MLGTTDFLVVGPWLRRTYFLLSVALALLTYGLARVHLAPFGSLAATALASLCLNAYCFSDLLYAEMPFAVTATLLAIFQHRAGRSASSLSATASGAMAVAGYLLRTAGLALLAAWVGESLLRRRFRQAALRLAVAAAPVVLWQGYILVVSAGPVYQRPAYPYQRADYYYSNVTYAQNSRLIDPFRPELGRATGVRLVTRALSNVKSIPAAMGEALSVSAASWAWAFDWVAHRVRGASVPSRLGIVPVLLLGALVVTGAVVMTARGLWFLPLCFTLSVGLISLAPWPEQFPRYLTPMIPFMALFLMVAIGFLADCSCQLPGLWPGAGRVAGTLLLAAVYLTDALWVARTFARLHSPVVYHDAAGREHVFRLMFYGPEWQALDASLEWVRRHADPGDVVATAAPHTAYVRTGLKAVLPPLVADPEEARRLLSAVPVRYVVLDSLDYLDLSPRYAGPAVRSDPARWRLVHTTPGRVDKASQVYESVK
jgi:hypothetical protein